MQIYTLVTLGWGIKDHPWNVTCTWSSRPELRQRLERGTASISAAQGQADTWNMALDAQRKTGKEQMQWSTRSRRISISIFFMKEIHIIFYSSFLIVVCLFSIFQCRPLIVKTLKGFSSAANILLFPEWQNCFLIGWDSLFVSSYFLKTTDLQYLNEHGRWFSVANLSYHLLLYWRMRRLSWISETVLRRSTVGLWDATHLKNIGSITPVLHFHHLWIKSSKLLSWDLQRTISK